jgi:penicillin amidase
MLDVQTIQTEAIPLADPTPLLKLLASVRSLPTELTPLRARLIKWGDHPDFSSPEGEVFTAWERALRWELASRAVPTEFRPGIAAGMNLVAALSRPSARWFNGDAVRGRDELLANALSSVSSLPADGAATTFLHPLAAFEETRKRFNVGPFSLPGTEPLVRSSGGRLVSAFGAIFDLGDWNRSTIRLAPGQSGTPSSSHYDDLATQWSVSGAINLLFDQTIISASAEDTLVLAPK